jgi:hypothetical protein
MCLAGDRLCIDDQVAGFGHRRVGGVEHVSAVANVDEQLILLIEYFVEVERAGGPAGIFAGREKLAAARDAVLLLGTDRACCAARSSSSESGAQRIAHAIHVD